MNVRRADMMFTGHGPVHAGEVIKPDTFKCIADEGMPFHGRPFQKGNLYIHFQVVFPDRVDPKIVSVPLCCSELHSEMQAANRFISASLGPASRLRPCHVEAGWAQSCCLLRVMGLHACPAQPGGTGWPKYLADRGVAGCDGRYGSDQKVHT